MMTEPMVSCVKKRSVSSYKIVWLAIVLLVFVGTTGTMEAQDIRVQHGSRNKMKDRKREFVEFLTVDGAGAYVLKVKTSGSSFFGTKKSKYYIDRYAAPNYAVDQTLELDMKDLDEDADVLQIEAKKDSVYLFSAKTLKKEKMRILYCSILSASTGKLLVRQQPIDTMNFEKRRDIESFHIVFSKNNSRILIQNDNPGNKSKEAEKFHIQVLDRNLNYKWGGLFELPYRDRDIQMLDFEVDEDGNVATLALHKVDKEDRKSRKDSRVAYSAFIYAHATGLSKEYDLNKGKDHLIDLQLFFEGDRGFLTVTGFYGVGNHEDRDGVYYLKIGMEDLKVAVENKQLFSKKDKTYFMSEKRAKKDKDLGHYIMRDIVRKADGGLYLIAENFYITIVTSRSTNRQGVTTESTTSTIYQNELMVISLDEKGSKQWVRMVPKYSTVSLNGTYYDTKGLPFQGYKLFLLGDGDLAFVYGDMQKNLSLTDEDILKGKMRNFIGGERKSCLTVCKVDHDGNVQRAELYDSKSIHGGPQISMSIVDYANEQMFLVNRSKRHETITKISLEKPKK